MIKRENNCVGCPPELGCRGSSCPYVNEIHLYCDRCGSEVEHLYWVDDEQLCEDCALEEFEEVNAEAELE